MQNQARPQLHTDIKQVRAVANKLGITAKQAEMFKREIEGFKRGVGKMNDMNFSFDELLEIGKEIVEIFK